MKGKLLFLGLSLFSFSLLFFFAQITNHQAFAQTAANTYNYADVDVNSNVPHNLHTWTQIVTLQVFSSIACQLGGFDPLTKDHTCLGYDTTTGKIGYVESNGGLIGLTQKGIAFSFNIPVHTSTYFQYLSQNFGVANKAYAAQTYPNGVGFTSLSPLFPIWLAIRNVVYLIFIIIFILVGVGVMLRVQIDPRTVMTIENQLPRIIITLIIITFSMAIAGVMIDAMWILIFFIINLMQSVDAGKGSSFVVPATSGIYYFPLKYLDSIWNGGFWGLVNSFFPTIQAFLANTFANNSANGLNAAANGTINTNCNWLTDFGCAMSNAFWYTINGLLTGLAAVIGYVVILVALFVGLIRVWVMLIRTYIYIIFNIILAPVYMIAGLIPGSNFGFGLWFRALASNLTVYVAVVFLFLLARVLNDQFATASGFFIPPLIGNPNAGVNVMGAVTTFAIIFVCPNAAQYVDRIYGIEDAGIGAVIMRNFAAGAQTSGNIARGALNTFRNPVTGKFEGGFQPLNLIPR